MQRSDDFLLRRKPLADLSEGELEELFWTLAEKIVEPLVELAYTSTSPSIERSVLLRMGFDSITAKSIAEGCEKRGLLRKGAGQVVLKYAHFKNIAIKEAGENLALGEGWGEIEDALEMELSFEGESHET
jgi:D-ornithine 4,5-aminomutase subunit alpha